jgi:hypothetical protein
VRKLVVLAVVAILVIGGGAILAILYLTDDAPSLPTSATEMPVAAPADDHRYNGAVMPPAGASGPSGPERPLPPNVKGTAGIPMQPAPDPRSDKMEAIRQDRFESSMDALNRRAEERLRRAGKRPDPSMSQPQKPAPRTPGSP